MTVTAPIESDPFPAAGGPAFHCSLAPIRLGQFDMGSVLYHANYFHLLEEIRENFFRKIGLPYAELAAGSLHFAIIESRQQFRAPIRYGDQIEAELRFDQIRRTSFRAIYQLFISGSLSRPVHRALTRHACIEAGSGSYKVTAIPEKVLEGFKLYTV